MIMDKAEELIDQIVASPRASNVGVLANDLLREFFRGYPIERLKALLLSQDVDVVSTGIWIASELGERNRPVLPDALALLDNPSKRVRFWALDSLFWALPERSYDLAKGVKMMEDVDPAVRWKALDFLTRASADQLGSALSALRSTEPNSTHVRGLEYLLNPVSSDPQSAISYLSSEDALLRKYGLVAAARLPDRSNAALAHASLIDDADIQAFVRTRYRPPS